MKPARTVPFGSSLLASVPGMAGSGSDRMVRKVSLASIMPDPRQPRRTLDQASIEELALSISSPTGLIQPIVVRPDREEEGRYIIVCGERRYQAVRHLGWPTVEVSIVMVEDPYEIRLIQTAENRQRLELCLPDEAANARETLALGIKLGKKQGDVAQDMGYSKAQFSRLLGVNEAPEPVMELVRSGKTRNAELVGILADIHQESPELFEQATKESVVSLPLARDMLRELKSGVAADQVAAYLAATPVSAYQSALVKPAPPAPPAPEPQGTEGGAASVQAAADSGEAKEGPSRRHVPVPPGLLDGGDNDAYTQRTDDAGGVPDGMVSTNLVPVTELAVSIDGEAAAILINDVRTNGDMAAVLRRGEIEIVNLKTVSVQLLGVMRGA